MRKLVKWLLKLFTEKCKTCGKKERSSWERSTPFSTQSSMHFGTASFVHASHKRGGTSLENHFLDGKFIDGDNKMIHYIQIQYRKGKARSPKSRPRSRSRSRSWHDDRRSFWRSFTYRFGLIFFNFTLY